VQENVPSPIPYGGQAVIEGVMIRGPRAMSIAVRAPDGSIVTRVDATETPLAASLRRVPFVRGVVTLCETFSLGIRSLYWSSRVASGRPDDRTSPLEIGISALTLTVAAAVFIAGPVLATGWLHETGASGWVEVVAEGLLRIAMLVGYIWFVGKLPEVQRVFAYHGAEHRAIHAHEHGERLTVDRIRGYPNAHPRCGTAFLLTVGALSFVVFTALGTPPLLERIAERVVLMPVIAAVAYEVLRGTAKWDRHPVLRLAQLPNLWLQKLTTRDPDDGQIEVAIAALNAALAYEAAMPAEVPAAGALEAVPVELPADIETSEA
jgi:uncharacterized protein YqhQ